MAESNRTTEVAELILCNNEANIYDCNQSDPMGSQSPIPLTDAWLVPVFFILIMFVGLVGNSLVIYVVVKNQQMKTVTNFYIGIKDSLVFRRIYLLDIVLVNIFCFSSVNLASTDILFLVCCVPFTATLYTLPSWIFGDFMCRLINYLQQVRAFLHCKMFLWESIPAWLSPSELNKVHKDMVEWVLCGRTSPTRTESWI